MEEVGKMQEVVRFPVGPDVKCRSGISSTLVWFRCLTVLRLGGVDRAAFGGCLTVLRLCASLHV